MSDTDKPTPESPDAGTSEANASPSGITANVISIEQARAELLRRPKKGATPPKGVGSPAPRSRGREVPAPVTLPPGEHSAVIVTDTPAARAHIDKKTVHPGEAPAATHEKKVRVKTHLDPRRAKTQVTDRRASTPVPGEVDVAGLWNSQPPSQPPPAATPSQPPPLTGEQRPSLIRPRPAQQERASGAPLFLIGVALAAALGAVLVYLLSRGRTEGSAPVGSTSATTVVATASAPPSTTAAATASAPGTTSDEPQGTTATPDLPTAQPPTTAKSGHSGTAAPRPTATASTTPTATAKPTTTSILPFGKEEP